MKLKVQLFNVLTKEPMIKQQINDASIEIHKMNDYPELMDQLGTQTYNLAVMTFVNTNNYKIVVEEGYYDVMKPFYQEGSNKEWVAYWKTMEKMVMHNKRFVVGMFTLIGLSFLLMILFADSSTINMMMLTLLFVSFLSLFVTKRIFTSKAKRQHNLTVENIKGHVGDETFEKLLKSHEEYTTKYFGIGNDNFEENNEDVIIDNESKDNKLKE